MQKKGSFVAVFFVAATALVALVLDFALSDLFVALRIEDTPILGQGFTLSTFSAVLAALIALVYCTMIDKRVTEFVGQCVLEFDKVAWPTWLQTRTSTGVVIMMAVIASLILGFFDNVFSYPE